MVKRCLGCGAVLQNTDKEINGYVPDLKFKICMRCHRLKNYGELKKEVVNKDNDTLIKIINENKKHVFFLIDILNISDEVIETYKEFKYTKTLLITKKDIIPKSIKDNNIIEYLRNNYNIEEDIYLVSAKKKENKNIIIKEMLNKGINSCYIVGYTNSGKSTLINSLLDNKIITESYLPDTTLDFLNIKIDDLTITDTPGFKYKKSIVDINSKLVKKVNCMKEIKTITYQTKENTSLVIENDLVISNFGINSITTYFSNDIKLEKKFNLDIKDFSSIFIPDNTDLVITGLGFINIKKACNLKISNKHLDIVSTRVSIFGGNNNG